MDLKIKDITKKYDDLTLFENLNLEFPENKITCILGPSGCGKTTLLNILAGLESFDSGNLYDFKNKTFSAIFQEPRLLPWKNVEENLMFVLKNNTKNEERKNLIHKYLDIVGLINNKDYYPSQLSGGMRQRVSIARAFIYPSDILIMDEPFTGLDIKIKTAITQTLLDLWSADKRTVIYVTHDISEALMAADQIYVFPKRASDTFHKFTINAKRKERTKNTEELAVLHKKLKNIILD